MRYGKTIPALTVMFLTMAACATTDDASTTGVTTGRESGTATPATVASTAVTGGAADSVPALTYPIVGTGQSACYDDAGGVITCPVEGEEFFGQDGNYVGTEASYVDNGDGTVTDLVTGLMWQQDPGAKMTYDEAIAAVDALGLADYDDWRLPTIKELYSLIDFSGTDPSGCDTTESCGEVPFIDADYFTFEYGDTSVGERVIDAQYLSSTLYVDVTMRGDETAFGVNFADGRIKGYGLTNPRGGDLDFFVIAVRDVPGYGENDFVDNDDETVGDLATGLTWQQADDGVSRSWAEAIDYCEVLDLAGYDDWRLPDAKELQSIVDYSRAPDKTGSAAIDPIFSASVITDEGGGDNYGFYWASTTHASLMGGMNAVYVAFGDALGWMQDPAGNYELLDVHGAGAQRSDPKQGDAAEYPYGNGPQGDVIRIDNLVRCVRGGTTDVTSGAFEVVAPSSDTSQSGSGDGAGGPLAEAAAILGVSEQDLANALGPPGDGEPDLAAAAAILGVGEEELRATLPPPGTP